MKKIISIFLFILILSPIYAKDLLFHGNRQSKPKITQRKSILQWDAFYAVATVNKKVGKTVYGDFRLLNIETREKIETTFMSGGKWKGKSIPFFEGIPFGAYDILLPNSQGHFRLEARDDCYGDDEAYRTGKSQLRLHENGTGTTIGCISIQDDKKWQVIYNMIIGAKSTDVTVKSLSRNPLKRGNPEKNTKLGMLIVENGIKENSR